MATLKWAAVAVTALFVLMNVGALSSSDLDAAYRAIAAVLGVAGLVAAIGLATDQTWGRPAVVIVGAANVATSIAALVTDEEGAVIGIVVGGLAVILGLLYSERTRVSGA